MAFQLLIARGNSEGQQFVVVQPVIRIGRDEDNDVVLSDVGVSRQHSRIFENLGRPWIEDLGSANGTLVNGERLGLPRELKTGDALAIGAALINFVEIDDLRRPGQKAVPSVPVSPRAITGEHPSLARAGMLPPPRFGADEDVVTASGEESQVPWETGRKKKQLYGDEHEVTAPVGKPVFGEDSTQPVGKPLLTDKRKVELEPKTELGIPSQPPVSSSPSLVPASVLKRAPDTSDQRTALSMPDLDPVARPNIEGPTKLTHQLGAGGPSPSFKRPAMTDEEASSNSLAPLDLSGSDFKPLADPDPTVADGQAFEDSNAGEPSVIVRSLPPAPQPPMALRHNTDAIPVRESAADRSRRRRLANESLGAQAAYWWGSLPTRTQATVTGVCALIVTVVIIGLFQLFRPEPGTVLPAEPEQISSERIRHSFGLGDGVDYPRPEAKEFVFDFVTPTEAAILIHYLAEEIDRDEVVVAVNGAEVGFVPPDIGVPDREIETLIPQRLLKRGERNRLVFDNVRNPPGSDRWRVGDLWIELLPVPPSTSAEAIRRARDLAKQAGQLYAQRDVGSENVFRSWKAYRQSWQLLLVVPEEARTTLFEQTRRKADEIGQELDRQCGALMLEAKKQMELKNPERAKEILLEVALYFPTNEHRCHALANEKLDEYQL
jgi:pSer/pThr/pTyr-binding forkhead associated (FHA) protein